MRKMIIFTMLCCVALSACVFFTHYDDTKPLCVENEIVVAWLNTLVEPTWYDTCADVAAHVVDVVFRGDHVVITLEDNLSWYEQGRLSERWQRHDALRQHGLDVFPLYPADLKRIEKGDVSEYSALLCSYLYKVKP
jgi:hypothetical protein